MNEKSVLKDQCRIQPCQPMACIGGNQPLRQHQGLSRCFVEPVQKISPGERQFVITHYRWDRTGTEELDNLFRIGAIANYVTETNNRVRPNSIYIGQYLPESFKVSMNIGNDGNFH